MHGKKVEKDRNDEQEQQQQQQNKMRRERRDRDPRHVVCKTLFMLMIGTIADQRIIQTTPGVFVCHDSAHEHKNYNYIGIKALLPHI